MVVFFFYRIGIIEKKLEDVMYETRGWEEKNKKLTDRVCELHANTCTT